MEPLIKEIGGEKFEMMPLPPKKAIKILIRLSKIVGGAVAKTGIKGTGKGIADSEIDFGSMLSGVFERLDEDNISNTIDEMLVHIGKYSETTGGYKKVTLEVDFVGKLGQLFEVIKEYLIYNYSDFLSGALGLIKK